MNDKCEDWDGQMQNCINVGGIAVDITSCEKYLIAKTDDGAEVTLDCLVRRIEANDFECLAGPLENCVEWIELKALIMEDN
jgi:hypothetical protein